MRIKLAPLPHQGPLDGAWWPGTRRPAAELNTLVAGLASRGVVATRLSLGVTTWDSTPGRLRLDDREVRLIWFAYRTRTPSSSGTASTRKGSRFHFHHGPFGRPGT